MRYTQFEVISVLLKEKAIVEDFVKEHANILIKAVKSIEKMVIKVEVLEY